MSKNNLKSSQKQSVVVKIGDTTYKRRRPKKKVSIKKIPIINTGPFVTGILSTPSMTPGSASVQPNISPFFQPRAVIAAGPPIIQRPINEPEAYDSLFSGPGRLLNRRPREFDLESDISDITDASSYGTVSSYNSGLPKEFRSVASQNSISSRGLEQIEIPVQGMGSNINPPSLYEIRYRGESTVLPRDNFEVLPRDEYEAIRMNLMNAASDASQQRQLAEELRQQLQDLQNQQQSIDFK